MSSTLEAAAPPAPGGPLSLWERTLRVFARPFRAWDGLETSVQWWFPVLVLLALQGILLALTYHRVLLPTMLEQWNQAVESGQMQPAQLDKISSFFSNSPYALLLIVGQQVVVVFIIILLVALVAWFGVGFVLGTKISYRLALEVVGWAGFVRLPETLVTFAIGWSQETFKGIHLGLAALLPPEDTPSKLHVGLSVLLDAVGPFSIWYLFVAVIGCSALSGAPRKSVAWVLIALYLALTAIFAAVAAFMAPGA